MTYRIPFAVAAMAALAAFGLTACTTASPGATDLRAAQRAAQGAFRPQDTSVGSAYWYGEQRQAMQNTAQAVQQAQQDLSAMAMQNGMTMQGGMTTPQQ